MPYTEYTPVKRCSSFWSWLLSSWRIRRRWEGPSVLVYEVGFRLFGFEFVREEKWSEE